MNWKKLMNIDNLKIQYKSFYNIYSNCPFRNG